MDQHIVVIDLVFYAAASSLCWYCQNLIHTDEEAVKVRNQPHPSQFAHGRHWPDQVILWKIQSNLYPFQ